MKTMTDREIKEFCFVLAKQEYSELCQFRESKEYAIAVSCDIEPTQEAVDFISSLLLRSVEYFISTKETSQELIDFANEMYKNKDEFLCNIICDSIISQIENNNAQVHEIAKNWAEKRFNEIIIKEKHYE